MVNFVVFPGNEKYVVDVGFGRNGPIYPLPLKSEVTSPNIVPGESRLMYENIKANINPDQRFWIQQYRKSHDDAWEATCCFTELEFLPQDYAIMNFSTSTSRQSWFTYEIAVVKMIMMGGEGIIGLRTLTGGEVKESVRGETKVLKVCETEQERIEILEKRFGIRLGEDERRGIEGLVTELKH